MSGNIPAVWIESFSYFSDDSLHLLGKLYLGNNGIHKSHSRELIIEALWYHTNREEFSRENFSSLNFLDIQLLLLLYLGIHTVRGLSKSLREYTAIEICLQLLHLQERMFVLQVACKNKASRRENRSNNVHLIPKIAKQLQGPDGAHFIIAPQFMAKLSQHLDFCVLFQGCILPEAHKPALRSPKLLLSSELFLASALYFAQESFPTKRKITKTQLVKCREHFPALSDEQLQTLRGLCLSCGLLCEGEQGQVIFGLEAFKQLWNAPYYQRLLALQACVAGFSYTAFAKLLSIWPQNMLLPANQLERLLLMMGVARNEASSCIDTMQQWHILLEVPELPISSSKEKEAYYQLNAWLYKGVARMENEGMGTEQQNRLSSNWEFYCDLRHPENYIDLLLCARLECFAELSLFCMEKSLFQKYFNAERAKFERFFQYIPQLERYGIGISNFIRQQWQEWFEDSTRFQLFEDCLLVCQPSYNELICRLLAVESSLAQKEVEPTLDILCNPQAGVFYLDKSRYHHWSSKLKNAGIHFSRPFSLVRLGESERGEQQRWSMTEGFTFPMEQALQACYQSPLVCSEVALPSEKPKEFPWDNWPTEPHVFVQSRQLVCSSTDFKLLHIHFREARGVDYTAKRNLLHSLLTARNHMAIITVATGDSFDLVPYMILPLSLDGPKEDPRLLALDLRQECLQQFRVKSITRVNEVFYSLINVCLLSLLSSDYIATLENKFRSCQD